MLKKISAAVALCLAGLTPAQSQEIAVFAAPTADYEGERVLSTSEVTLTQDVYSTTGKTRTEMTHEGQEIIQIWRDDLQKIWFLQPSEQIALELSYGDPSAKSPFTRFDPGAVILERRREGVETVNGVSAEKTYINAKMSTGEQASGWVWATSENITVRMRLTVMDEDGGAQPMQYDLNNLEIAEQPAWLFEIPANYKVVAATPGDSVLASYLEDVAEDAGNAAKDEAEREVKSRVRNAARKAIGSIFD